MTPPSTLSAALNLGPITFDRPEWLLIVLAAWTAVLFIGRKSLSGLGTTSRRVALGIRLVVIALIGGALAEPQFRKVAENVTTVVVLDVSKSVPPPLQERARQWVEQAIARKPRSDDRVAYVTVASNAIIHSLPSSIAQRLEHTQVGPTEATNLAKAVRLALALKSSDAALRVLLATDANETAGSLQEASDAAVAQRVPIDSLPLPYVNPSEITVDELIAPTTARMGDTVSLKVRITASQESRGRLTVTVNGQPVDLDPASSGVGVMVSLDPGENYFPIPVTLPRAGVQKFEAFFEPATSDAGATPDTIVENNRAEAVTFVSSQGRVLVIGQQEVEAAELMRALQNGRIDAAFLRADEAPQNLTEMNGYDAIITVNMPIYAFSQAQIEDLKRYVHDSGGGLLMVGGPDAFGAGGWIGSTLEDALPIKLDPPQKQQMLRGALVLVMHSIEMPQGIHYGKKTADAAVDALTRLDYAGIVEFTGRGGAGAEWVHPLSELGDKVVIRQAINNLAFGDMPSFDPSLQLALQGLSNVDAGQKMVIVISDGDPSLNTKILSQFQKARITITTVGVFPHSPSDLATLKTMADQTQGTFYAVQNTGQLATLPQIFFKEAQRIRRPLIWEGDPFVPTFTGQLSETMRGIRGIPPITGYVVAAERDGPVTVTLVGKENDPIAAHWQYGLGRTAVFTSDATTRWTTSWSGWGQFDQFWEQQVRWVMRPAGDAHVRTSLIRQGESTRVVVEMTDPDGNPRNFATFRGRVTGPDGTAQDVTLVQQGPGRYVGEFPSRESGAYVMNLLYSAPGPSGGEPVQGSVQASVSRPFADEFRSLRDNTALLRQVAAKTGGQVFDLNLPPADLWSRENLVMPVSKTPIWLPMTIVGLAVFLLDVAVRRVRIDVIGIWMGLIGALQRTKAQTASQVDALRAAREAARSRITEQTRTDEPKRADPAAAGVKFEASEQDLASRMKGKDPQIVDAPGIAAGEPPKKESETSRTGDEGISRLKQAKRRARQEFDENG